MATLNFKGKTFVQNHHLAVKYHQLIPKKDKSLTDKVSLNDNLIIHGENLKALKAFLPTNQILNISNQPHLRLKRQRLLVHTKAKDDWSLPRANILI